MVEKFTNSDRKDDEYKQKSTRRQALSAIGTVGAGGLLFPGIVAGDNDEYSSEVTEYEPKSIGEYDGGDRVKVEEGVTDWISDNDETPDWFTIHEDDEVRYKPHGVISEDNEVSTQDAELCLPTSVDVGPATVGIEACHYGGCEWEVNVCLAACIGTGRNDDCSSEYKISGDIGVVNAELVADPRSDSGWGVDRIHVSGELCYYYVTGSSCETVNHTFHFQE
ncbi:hypothetical protein RBH26_08870 [Natronolimnohabitans sp. A-GB9]|uniref:hypothetical protein n=1 Tax=Natronolimnohabitans sp. A-GB9 TaxID=3069757 RepID=UPI0027B667BA|nr:hypothetical protein [Natronolimnohabitans sp. A-GB9]MDQ2050599.1 hypothetical protein [Natronolimnohabitans sp. A-GB9]